MAKMVKALYRRSVSAYSSDDRSNESEAEPIEQHFARQDASPQSLLEDLNEFANGAPLEDDATVVTIDVRSPGA
jgi:hypothetical protein